MRPVHEDKSYTVLRLCRHVELYAEMTRGACCDIRYGHMFAMVHLRVGGFCTCCVTVEADMSDVDLLSLGDYRYNESCALSTERSGVAL